MPNPDTVATVTLSLYRIRQARTNKTGRLLNVDTAKNYISKIYTTAHTYKTKASRTEAFR